jgi:8-oxo-dGTP pyrophosphatase MutT (NUDIX family)
MKDLSAREIRELLYSRLTTGSRKEIKTDGFHRAAVLVPIVRTTDTYELLFTKRTEVVETHKGQISFPGGMVDDHDPDVVHAALREAHEEVGIPVAAVETVGLLDDLPTPRGVIITPVVGIIDTLPELRVNAIEVEEVFRMPLMFFADQSKGRMETREFQGRQREVWYYESGKHTIWGVTAMIIRSLLKKMELVPPQR